MKLMSFDKYQTGYVLLGFKEAEEFVKIMEKLR